MTLPIDYFLYGLWFMLGYSIASLLAELGISKNIKRIADTLQKLEEPK